MAQLSRREFIKATSLMVASAVGFSATEFIAQPDGEKSKHFTLAENEYKKVGGVYIFGAQKPFEVNWSDGSEDKVRLKVDVDSRGFLSCLRSIAIDQGLDLELMENYLEKYPLSIGLDTDPISVSEAKLWKGDTAHYISPFYHPDSMSQIVFTRQSLLLAYALQSNRLVSTDDKKVKENQVYLDHISSIPVHELIHMVDDIKGNLIQQVFEYDITSGLLSGASGIVALKLSESKNKNTNNHGRKEFDSVIGYGATAILSAFIRPKIMDKLAHRHFDDGKEDGIDNLSIRLTEQIGPLARNLIKFTEVT